MTEAEWLACRNWEALFGPFTGGLTGRKLHLFACACCRRIWHLLHDRSKKVVELAEGRADGSATEEEVRAAVEANQGIRLDAVATNGVAAVGWFTDKDIVRGVSMITGNAACCVAMKQVPGIRTSEWEAFKEAEEAEQAKLFRDIMGNPYRPATISPKWLKWNDAIVPKLAHAIYDVRRFSDLPVLADALEEAGCTDADILNHCRQPGEHARGCWVVDLLLVKK
jgi:hypothetical protein